MPRNSLNRLDAPFASALRRALSGALAISLAATVAGPAAAQIVSPFDPPNPALFVAQDDDTTIYLFGTIHVVPCIPDMRPPVCATGITPTIREAIAASDEVWLEVADLDGAAAALEDPAYLAEVGTFRNGSRLSDFIDPEEIAVIAEAVRDTLAQLLGTDLTIETVATALDMLVPWVITAMLSTPFLETDRWNDGVDFAVEEIAVERGVPVMGFETIDEQLAFMTVEPFESQIKSLRYQASLLQQGIDVSSLYEWVYEEIWNVWSKGQLDGVHLLALGDIDLLSEVYDAEIAAHLGMTEAEYAAVEAKADLLFPRTEQAEQMAHQEAVLIEGRNLNWMSDIEDMLDRPGTFFIAVGAAHLVGEFGLPTLIEDAGATVERVQ